MATKTMNEKKQTTNESLRKWTKVPLAAWMMDLGMYAIPSATLGEMVVMARALAQRTLVDPTPGEAASRGRMKEAYELCAEALEHNLTLATPQVDQRKGRMRLVRLVASAIEMVEVRERSPRPQVAAAAAALKVEVFGAGLDAVRMDGRNLVLRLEGIGTRLDQQPGLRERLEECVPRDHLDELFEEAARYGARWGEETKAQAEKAPALDLRILRDHLRQRAGEYVANVLATVNADEPATVARATKALEPLVELREDLSSRRARRARKQDVAEETETDDEELDLEPVDVEEEDEAVPTQPAPTKPSAAPPATAPVTEDDG